MKKFIGVMLLVLFCVIGFGYPLQHLGLKETAIVLGIPIGLTSLFVGGLTLLLDNDHRR